MQGRLFLLLAAWLIAACINMCNFCAASGIWCQTFRCLCLQLQFPFLVMISYNDDIRNLIFIGTMPLQRRPAVVVPGCVRLQRGTRNVVVRIVRYCNPVKDTTEPEMMWNVACLIYTHTYKYIWLQSSLLLLLCFFSLSILLLLLLLFLSLWLLLLLLLFVLSLLLLFFFIYFRYDYYHHFYYYYD